MTSEKLMLAGYKYPVISLFAFLFIFSGYLLGERQFLFSILSAAAGFITVLMLIGAFENTRRQITFFFSALRNNDTSIRFQTKTKNRSLAAFYDGMNQLNSYFQSIKIQNEFNENFYKTLIHHSASGLVVLDPDNRILLINRIACNYAGIPPDSVNPQLAVIKNPPFFQALCNLKPGMDEVYKQIDGTEYHLLAFRTALLRIGDKDMKIISIHDIRSEMEARELESYRKLISVLTHEIMNLVSPLTSVSSSLQSLYLADGNSIRKEEVTDELMKTTQTGLQLIYEHSSGLKQFIETYRKISRIPKPVKKCIVIDEWISQIQIAFSELLNENRIRLEILKDHHISEFSADKSLMNQVLLNMLNNAIDALKEKQEERVIKIEFSIRTDNRVRIAICNNGPVIPPEMIEKIFVPFFTTKRTGSGIGLSICQEIIRLHNGSLTVISPSDGMTKFIMEL